MSDREWPAWARQDEAPIAVMAMYTNWRRPDEGTFNTALYADGTVLRHPSMRPVECQTPEFVRQIIAAIDFPGSAWERLEWDVSRRQANARRATLPAPSRKEDAHV